MNNDTTELVRCSICGQLHDPSFCTELADGRTVCNECVLDIGLVECADCGALFLGCDMTEVQGGNQVCRECLDDNYNVCCDCGELVPKDELAETTDGDYVCGSCRNNGDWFYCEDCERWFKDGNGREVDGRYVCDSCIDHGDYHQCEDCGDYHHEDNMHDVGGPHSYRWVCEDCYDNYHYCDRCGSWVGDDDYNFDREMCCTCAEEDDDENGVHEYHWGHGGWIGGPFFCNDEPRILMPLTYGVEIEMAGGDFDIDAMGDGDEMYHFEHDGSLDDDGVELITQPCSLAYHQNEFGWENILQKSTRRGFRSHDCTSCSCGFHVHIGRRGLTQTDELKLDVWFNRYAEWWKHIARRNSTWGRMDPDKEMVYCIRSRNGSNNHNAPVNHGNMNTVEIRVAKGTLNPETVLGTIEAYDAIIHYLRGVGCYELYNLRNKVWNGYVQFLSGRPKEYGHAIRMVNRLMNFKVKPVSDAVKAMDFRAAKKDAWNKSKAKEQ